MIKIIEQYSRVVKHIMPDIKFKIIKYIAVLSEATKGWKKELNLISWNEQAA
jgi:hypothetical protein